MSIIHVDTEEDLVTLKENFAPPFVVDFYADWCGPCKMIAPIFEELSEEVDNATFVKVNVEKSEIHKRYGVRNIPAIVVLSDFEAPPVTTIVGSKPASEFKRLIKESVEGITNGK